MIFKFLGRNREPVPDKGTFRGVQYRIDGDAVVLRCSSGQEISFTPIPEDTPEDFDRQRRRAAPALIPMIHRELEVSTPTDKDNSVDRNDYDLQGESGPDNFFESAQAYGISLLEYRALKLAANDLMKRYWKSHRSKKTE